MCTVHIKKKKYKTRDFAALQHRDQLINNSRVHFGVNSIKDLFRLFPETI